MLHIDENTLNHFLAAGNVQRFELRKSGERFGVYFFIAAIGDDEPKEAMLITTRMKQERRKTPRSWASVDSFCEFVKARAPNPPTITIVYDKGGTPAKKQ